MAQARTSEQPRGGYRGKWKKWVLVYLVAAAVVYGIVYFLFFYHSGSGYGGGSGGGGGGAGGYVALPFLIADWVAARGSRS
jgi:hypothetical protein